MKCQGIQGPLRLEEYSTRTFESLNYPRDRSDPRGAALLLCVLCAARRRRVRGRRGPASLRPQRCAPAASRALSVEAPLASVNADRVGIMNGEFAHVSRHTVLYLHYATLSGMSR